MEFHKWGMVSVKCTQWCLAEIEKLFLKDTRLKNRKAENMGKENRLKFLVQCSCCKCSA